MKRNLVFLMAAALCGCGGFESTSGNGKNGGNGHTDPDGNCAKVVLTWTNPTERTDGQPLNEPIVQNIIGYGFQSRNYAHLVEVNFPGPNPTYEIPLDPGYTYYFAVKAVAETAGTSEYSNEVSKFVQACGTFTLNMNSGQFKEVHEEEEAPQETAPVKNLHEEDLKLFKDLFESNPPVL